MVKRLSQTPSASKVTGLNDLCKKENGMRYMVLDDTRCAERIGNPNIIAMFRDKESAFDYVATCHDNDPQGLYLVVELIEVKPD